MAVAYAPRVSETVTVTGTGTVTLSGTAVTAYQSWFSGFGASGSATVGYCIVDNTTNAWETGVGAYNGGNPGTLTRGFLFSSTGAAVSFAGNSCTVSCDFVPNATGQLDVSAMPIGPGSPSLVPISGNLRILGIPNCSNTTTGAITASRQYFFPFLVTQLTLISNLGTRITTAVASSTFSVGIYADNGNAGGVGNQPTSAPIVYSSGISGAATGNIFAAVNAPYTLQPGIIYWMSLIASAAISTQQPSANTVFNAALGVTSSGVMISGYYLTGTGSTLINPVSGTFTAISGNTFPFILFS